MNTTLRYAEPKDVALIANFNKLLAEETEGKSLDLSIVEPGVAAIINDKSLGTYFVATQNDAIIGQLLITYEWSDWRNGCFWWIQSVYVDKNNRQQGIYSQLYAHVKGLAKKERAVCGIRLYVEHDNQRAQTTYSALGMDKTPYLIMQEEF